MTIIDGTVICLQLLAKTEMGFQKCSVRVTTISKLVRYVGSEHAYYVQNEICRFGKMFFYNSNFFHQTNNGVFSKEGFMQP